MNKKLKQQLLVNKLDISFIYYVKHLPIISSQKCNKNTVHFPN